KTSLTVKATGNESVADNTELVLQVRDSANAVQAGIRRDGYVVGGLIGTVDNTTAALSQGLNPGVAVNSTSRVWFSSAAWWGTADVSFIRTAAKVVGIRDGTTGGGTLSSVPLSPSQITANQNDYAPGVARYYRLSTDASRDVT